jgi:hypothetical protein
MVAFVAFIPNPGNLAGRYLSKNAAGVSVGVVACVETENLCHGRLLAKSLLAVMVVMGSCNLYSLLCGSLGRMRRPWFGQRQTRGRPRREVRSLPLSVWFGWFAWLRP